MNMRKMIPMLMILLVSMQGNALAQALGQFEGAGVAPDGEGGVFMLAGNDAFRTGLSARFNLSRVSDFGIQLGLDRVCETSFYGGGVDVKVVLLESTAKFPVSLALDASFGSLASSEATRFLFDFGVLASGRIGARSGRAIEPYLSLLIDIEQIDDKEQRAEAAECLCSNDDDSTETGSLVRAGVKIPVSDDGQVLIEASLGERSLVGAAFNLVF